MAKLDVTNVVAIVLCGGQSRRMGQPKAWLDVEGKPLLQHVVEQLDFIERVIVVKGIDQALPPLGPGVGVIEDRWPGAGPLGALATVLPTLVPNWLALVVSVDTPMISPAVCRLLLGMAHETGRPAAMVSAEGFWYPFPGVYPARLGNLAVQHIESGRRPMQHFLTEANGFPVALSHIQLVDPELTSLQNLNTPEDYQRWLKRATKPSSFPAESA